MHKNHKSCMFIFHIIPLVTNEIFGPLCKFNTVKAIWLKLHILLEHNVLSTRTITWLGYFGVIPFDHLQWYFMSSL